MARLYFRAKANPCRRQELRRRHARHRQTRSRQRNRFSEQLFLFC